MTDDKELSILRLTLKREPFEVMVTGEKPHEFRTPGEWIERRLLRYDKSLRHYDLVEFRNGYGRNRPWFRCKYLGAEKIRSVNETYSNGLHVEVARQSGGGGVPRESRRIASPGHATTEYAAMTRCAGATETRHRCLPDPTTRISLDRYLGIRAWLLEHDPDGARMYEWSETQTGPPASPEQCAGEIIWIILCAGRKAQAARTIQKKVYDQIHAGRPVLEAFGHRGKAAAIETAWRDRGTLFAEFQGLQDPEAILAWCADRPWVGAITKYQLAKNFGADVCKPDIWLCRLAGIADGARLQADERFHRCQALCAALAAGSGDRAATVDTMLWLACNKGVVRVSTDAGPVSLQLDRDVSRLRPVLTPST